MSHPPECEALLRDGAPCGNWVHEPDGPGTAEKYETVDGRELWICLECKRHAIRGVLMERGRKIHRNDPCPCASGRKFKKCHGRNS